MSDKNFDDTLLDDYKTESSESQELSIQEPKKKGSVLKGVGIGIVITIVLELGVGLALNVQTNLVHRYVAYLLGLIPIFVAAIYTRSILKMFFIGAPVLILTSFALPFFLPDIFSGLMTPFLTLLPMIDRANTILADLGAIDASTQSVFDLVQQYGIALDFLFGIFVGLFAAIGLTGIVKIVSQKPGILSIFTFIFSMIFLLIGVIILPYFLVITSGIAHFTMSFGVGGALLGQGTDIATDSSGDLSEANRLFTEAQEWFNESEAMLNGLRNMGLFWIATTSNPNIGIIVNNGIVLLNAAVDLAQGLAPALAGFGAMSRGMDQAMGSLQNSAATSALLLSQEQSEFEEGIDLVERGFQNFTQAIPNIKEAIDRINNDVDRQELADALNAIGGGDINAQMDFIFTALPLLDITLDVFTNSELPQEDRMGLLDDPDGIQNDTQRSPLVHLLLAAKSMSDIQEQIGETTSFEGTGPGFKELNYHLDFVTDSLDPQQNEAVGDLEDLVLEDVAPNAVVDLRDKITGSVAFIRDAGDTTIQIGKFGIIASPTLTSMNETIKFITESDDFTQIPVSEFDDALNVFDGNATIDQGIVVNSTRMQDQAATAKTYISSMDNQTTNEEYGYFNSAAGNFVSEFKAFNLTKNANNFYNIATGFSYLIKAMKEMTFVDAQIANIDGNVTIIETEIINGQIDFDNTDYSLAEAHVQNASNTVPDVQTSLQNANNTLQVAKSNLFNSSLAFNSTEDMPQLQETADSLASIAVHMENIQVGDGGTNQGLTGILTDIGSIETSVTYIYNELTTGDPVGNSATITAEFNSIKDTYIPSIQNEISFIDGEFALIQSDLSGVSIAA